MQSFNFHLPTKISFGQPVQEALPFQLAALNARKILLVSDRGLQETGILDTVQNCIKDAGVEVTSYLDVSSNPTSDEVMAGLTLAQERKIEVVVALGGGSSIDVAKGIAMLMANGGAYADYQWGGRKIEKRSWPLVAVPTTAGTGSEVSKVAVVSDPDNPFKKGVLHPFMFPHIAVVDPELTRSLPPQLTAATGMDTFIHAMETFIGLRANPFSDQFAKGALQATWTYLPRAVRDGADMEAREQMMLAALWGGIAMDHAGLGLIHALSGPLTTHCHLHHGLANALLLPYILRFNLPAISSKRLRILNMIFGLSGENNDTLIAALTDFVSALDLPLSLSQLDISLESADREKIADETLQMILIKNNPRAVSKEDICLLLEQMR